MPIFVAKSGGRIAFAISLTPAMAIPIEASVTSGIFLPRMLGANAAIAIFTPPAIVMVVASQAMEFFKKSFTAKAIMKGIRSGVIGMIFFAAYELGSKIDHSSLAAIWPSIVIFAGALFVLVKYNVDVVYIIPTAGLIGYFLYQ